MKSLISFSLLIIVMQVGLPAFSNMDVKPATMPSSSEEVKPCTEKPGFIAHTTGKRLENRAELPKSFWVARKAEFYVESIKENIQIHTLQNFVDADSDNQNSKIICGTGIKDEKVAKSYVIQGPTFIDLSKEQKEGNSLWQFQAYIYNGIFRMENRVSHILSQKDSFDEMLASLNGEFQFYQLSPKRYELLIFKRDRGANQYLSIIFDIVDKI